MNSATTFSASSSYCSFFRFLQLSTLELWTNTRKWPQLERGPLWEGLRRSAGRSLQLSEPYHQSCLTASLCESDLMIHKKNGRGGALPGPKRGGRTSWPVSLRQQGFTYRSTIPCLLSSQPRTRMPLHIYRWSTSVALPNMALPFVLRLADVYECLCEILAWPLLADWPQGWFEHKTFNFFPSSIPL